MEAMAKLIVLSLAIILLAGCTKYACIDGQQWSRDPISTGLWKKTVGDNPCYCSNVDNKPVPCAEKP